MYLSNLIYENSKVVQPVAIGSGYGLVSCGADYTTHQITLHSNAVSTLITHTIITEGFGTDGERESVGIS